MAAAPTLAQLQSDVAQLRSLKETLPAVAAVFVGDDWKTRGDWVGRLGRQYTILCAMDAPLNDEVIADLRYRVRGGVGPNGGAFGPPKEKREGSTGVPRRSIVRIQMELEIEWTSRQGAV